MSIKILKSEIFELLLMKDPKFRSWVASSLLPSLPDAFESFKQWSNKQQQQQEKESIKVAAEPESPAEPDSEPDSDSDSDNMSEDEDEDISDDERGYRKRMANAGIYVATTDQLVTGKIYKIAAIQNLDRALDFLNPEDSIPHPYYIVYTHQTTGYNELEDLLHCAFNKLRVNDDFFILHEDNLNELKERCFDFYHH